MHGRVKGKRKRCKHMQGGQLQNEISEGGFAGMKTVKRPYAIKGDQREKGRKITKTTKEGKKI